MQLIYEWFKRTFSDPQLVVLLLLLVGGFAIIITMGNMLAPLLASLVIAYLLEGLTGLMERRGMPRMVAVLIVFSLFMVALALILFGLMPLLYKQVTELLQQLPRMLSQGQQALMALPEKYPELVSPEQINNVIQCIRE